MADSANDTHRSDARAAGQPLSSPNPSATEPDHSASAAIDSAGRCWKSWLRLLLVAAAGLALDLVSKHWAFHSLRQAAPPRVVVPHVLELQIMLNKGALFGIGGGRTGLFLVASLLALVLVGWMFMQTPRQRWILHVSLGAVLAGAAGNMYDRATVRLLDVALPHGDGYVFVQRVGSDDRGEVLIEYPPDVPDAAQFRMRSDPRHPGTVLIQQYPTGYVLRLREPPREVGFVRDFLKIPTTVPRWSWLPEKWQGREAWPWVFNVADTLLVVGVAVIAIHLWRGSGRRPRAGQEAAHPAG